MSETGGGALQGRGHRKGKGGGASVWWRGRWGGGVKDRGEVAAMGRGAHLLPSGRMTSR